VIFSPKYSTDNNITEAHVRIHAIEELQPLNHQKLHQHGRCLCPAYGKSSDLWDWEAVRAYMLLTQMREYWRIYRPAVFLFERSVSGGPLSVRTAQAIFQHAKAASGIQKKASAHTLRHSFTSRNRACPKCQWAAQARWVRQREGELLNTQYFHFVFTVPHALNALFLSNDVRLYNLLFRCAWETLDQLARQPRWLGAQPGMLAVLHIPILGAGQALGPWRSSGASCSTCRHTASTRSGTSVWSPYGTENPSSQAHKSSSGQWKRGKTSPRKCLSKKCLSPQGRPAKPAARTTGYVS